MTWKDIPKPVPTPPGEWEAFSYGNDYFGWVLRCGPAFLVHIHQAGGSFYTTINNKALPVRKTGEDARLAAELAIIQKVRLMLPCYKVICERVAKRKNLDQLCELLPPDKEFEQES